MVVKRDNFKSSIKAVVLNLADHYNHGQEFYNTLIPGPLLSVHRETPVGNVCVCGCDQLLSFADHLLGSGASVLGGWVIHC